ncbi:hypothetical protein GCM10023189_48830 [Nibrella saemangeumensis]|uniref:Gas vesicle protein n=1 Tax=Nibrella saemangeumensis TaxID=1084526 RepID=A0ABP8NHN7_9BACT
MRSLPGLLFGLAAGAVVGILLAPRSGRETRERISTDADNFFRDLQDQLQTGLDNIKSQYNEVVEANASRFKGDAGGSEPRV